MRILALALVAIVAGCAEPTPSAPSDPEQTTGSDAKEGLRLDVTAWQCGKLWCLNATATNTGDATVHISNICTPAFLERMYSGDDRVTPRPQGGSCAAFGTRPFPPGDEASMEYTWDERLYDHDVDRMVAAPSGDYDWGTLFVAYRDTSGGDAVLLEATATIRVD